MRGLVAFIEHRAELIANFMASKESWESALYKKREAEIDFEAADKKLRLYRDGPSAVAPRIKT